MPVGDPDNPAAPKEKVWRIDARQNFYFIGDVPVFYWPRILTDTDDLDPPLRQIQFRANNYFGQQFLTDWSMFKLLGVRKPAFIDTWNLDLDYLSYRGFAAGTEIGWFGRDLIDNITDPYNRDRNRPERDYPYFGYLDIWGLKDHGWDTLGGGPAIVTNAPPRLQGRLFDRSNVPPFQDFRGRFQTRHMQSLIEGGGFFDEDFRLQLEGSYVSDRHFLEQYYKRLFDTGLDQTNLAYLIWQSENRALTGLTEANLLPWQTETQWFPKIDYFRLGDAPIFQRFTYFQDWGVDYANTHTAVEVANPDVFAFLPYDPVSLTSQPLKTGRLWTSHEIDLPINLDFLRIVPYAQGQLVGWDNQYQQSLPPLQYGPLLPPQSLVRGAAGVHARPRLGGLWRPGRRHDLEALPRRRERVDEPARPGPQDQLRGRLPQRLLDPADRTNRHSGRSGRQHV